MQLILSLFPGIDLLGQGFEAEGYCVVRGPDRLWGGDIQDFHCFSGRFDGVIGGPPCQDFTVLFMDDLKDMYLPEGAVIDHGSEDDPVEAPFFVSITTKAWAWAKTEFTDFLCSTEGW